MRNLYICKTNKQTNIRKKPEKLTSKTPRKFQYKSPSARDTDLNVFPELLMRHFNLVSGIMFIEHLFQCARFLNIFQDCNMIEE